MITPKRRLADQGEFGSILPMPWMVWTAIGLWIVSGISLLFSYEFVTSQAWLVEFGTRPEQFAEGKIEGIGGVIEWIRSGIGIAIGMMLLGAYFRQEFLILIGVERDAENGALVKQYRLGWAVLTLVAVAGLVWYHSFHGPNALSNASSWSSWSESNDLERPLAGSAEWRDEYRVPYLAYLPYSAINYLLIWLPVLITTVYAATCDVRAVGPVLNSNAEWSSLRELSSCDEIMRRFEAFSHEYSYLLGRYTALFVFVVAAIGYEYHVGSFTLAESALWLARAAYLLFASAIVVVVLTFRVYERAVSKVARDLLEKNCREDVEKLRQFSSVRVVMRVARGNALMAFGIVLALGLFPQLKDLFGGFG